MDIKEIKELMTQLEGSQLKKLVVKKGDFELHLEKESAFESPLPKRREVVVHEPESTFHSGAPLKEKGSSRSDSQGNYVISPMVGTFYSSSAPNQPVFVKAGDQVNEDTVVCIIEAMKVMNEVKAGVKGTVAEVLVENAQPVEFGTRLIRVT